jgi:hypothetical protein
MAGKSFITVDELRRGIESLDPEQVRVTPLPATHTR